MQIKMRGATRRTKVKKYSPYPGVLECGRRTLITLPVRIQSSLMPLENSLFVS